MTLGMPLDRDECIEQAYFFRTFRERVEANLPAQDVLRTISQELLTTTRLPLAVQFLAVELKHSGLLSSGFAKLPHYFTPFQHFVARQSEEEKRKFPFTTALLILEREATYKAGTPTPSGLFVYQLEAITRNKLGYEDGLVAMSEEPFYDTEWRQNADMVRRQLGIVELSELVYLRSHQFVMEQRKSNPAYQPSLRPLFGEKEGKIARASKGRDPLFLFAALQRQLGYPEVPRPKPKDDTDAQVERLEAKLREMETRIRILEAEARGTFDPTEFGKPEMFRDIQDEE
jgi:hypothetical protein